MRAIAGSILVLSAAVLLASVRIASRLPGPPSPDDASVNAILILLAFVVGIVGVAVAVRGFRRPGGSLSGERPVRAAASSRD